MEWQEKREGQEDSVRTLDLQLKSGWMLVP
jgi:hypothetical protein